MNDEYIDVFDEKFNLIGCQPREEIHKSGYWHQTFHCWVVHKTEKAEYLVFQLRQDDRDNYPNCFDITSAGHLQAGENPEDGIREVKEEIGLDIKISDLKKVGIVKSENINGEYMDREFQHVYVYRTEKAVDSFKIQFEEVKGLIEIPMCEAKKFMYGDIETVSCEGFELDSEKKIQYRDYVLTSDRFVQYSREYLDKLFKAIYGTK